MAILSPMRPSCGGGRALCSEMPAQGRRNATALPQKFPRVVTGGRAPSSTRRSTLSVVSILESLFAVAQPLLARRRGAGDEVRSPLATVKMGGVVPKRQTEGTQLLPWRDCSEICVHTHRPGAGAERHTGRDRNAAWSVSPRFLGTRIRALWGLRGLRGPGSLGLSVASAGGTPGQDGHPRPLRLACPIRSSF